MYIEKQIRKVVQFILNLAPHLYKLQNLYNWMEMLLVLQMMTVMLHVMILIKPLLIQMMNLILNQYQQTFSLFQMLTQANLIYWMSTSTQMLSHPSFLFA